MINIKNKTKKGVKIKYSKYLVYLVILIILVPFIKADLAGATPEAYSFMKAPGPSVNLFTGDMSLGIPVMAVPGRGMNFPITLSYAAGIRIGQEASWVGLGWNFFPGSITRNVNGIPDDYKAGGDFGDENIGIIVATGSNLFEYLLDKPDWDEEPPDEEGMDDGTGNVVKVTGMATQVESSIINEEIKKTVETYNNFHGTSNNGLYNVNVPAGQINQIIAGMNMGEGQFCGTMFSANGFMYFKNNFLNIYDDECSMYDDKKDIDRMNPDSFSISGPVSGQMMFINDDDKFHLKSFSGSYNTNRDDQTKIDYEMNDDGTIASFTITAKDGTRYVYDYPVYNVNQNGYSSFEDETKVETDPSLHFTDNKAEIKRLMMDNVYQGDYFFKRRGLTTNTELLDYVSKAQNIGDAGVVFQRYFFRKFAYSWFLTAILAPNYEDKTGDGPTKDDKGNWIKFNYEKTYGIDGENPEPFEYRTPFNAKDDDINFGIESCAEYSMYGSGCSKSANTGYMEIAYLKSIETPTHKAEFKTSFRNDGAEYSPLKNKDYKSGRTSKKLDEINLMRNGNLISKVKLTYDYSLNKNTPNNIKTGKDSGKLTLLKIEQFDKNENKLPETKFFYNSLNPSWDETFIDTNVGKHDIHTDVTDNHFDDFGYYWKYGSKNSHKILDNQLYKYNKGARLYDNDATAWSLTRVKWPSGSETEFEYETKKYSQLGGMLTRPTHVGESEVGGAGLSYGDNVEHYGGGIRVKSVIQSGQNSYTTKYEYEDGIKSYGDPMAEGRGVTSAFNPRFVGYGKVTESISDIRYPYGKIVHEFTTRNDYPPIQMETTFWRIDYPYNFEDRSALIGLGKKTTVYDNENNVISISENEFDFDEQLKWAEKCVEKESCFVTSGRGRAEKIKFYWIRPTKTINTLDGITKTTEYKFNNINGLPSETTESGDNVKTRKITTSYAFNEYPEMLNNHILTKPYITELKDGFTLISKSRTEYYDYPYYVRSASVWDNIKKKDLTTTFNKYDDYGNLLETTDPKTYKTYFEYSPVYDYAYLTKGKNALGHEMLTDYNPEFGVVTSITDFNKQTTHYGYDTFGRLITVTKDNMVLNSYEYDDKSFDWRKTKTRIDVLKEMNLIEYFDDFARLDKTELKVDDNTNIITKTEYNNFLMDKIDKIYKPDYTISTLFTSTEYEKSPLARIKKIDPPGEGDIKTDYSNQESMYKTSVTDEELRVKSSLTDVFGNLRKIIEPGNLQTTYTYDIQNNLLTITDSKGRKMTDNKYNSLGQLIESWQADTGTTKFKYDDNGNMIERNQNGVITTYEYDKLNRLIKINYPTNPDVTNTYDDGCIDGAYQIGKLCQVSDSSGTMQFQYDNWGRVVKEIKNVNEVNEEYIMEYIYNDINDITEIKLFKGTTELNKINYEYNNLNQLVKVKVSNQEISYTYNPTSTIDLIEFGNTKTTNYTYTERDWLKTLTTSNILEDTLNYDKVGNIMGINEQRTEKKDDGLFYFDTALKKASYTYDDLDRLTFVDDNNYYGKDIGYFYDSVGNRLMRYTGTSLSKATSESEAKSTASSFAEYAVSAANNQMKEDGENTYNYDVNGNMLKKISIADGTTTEYIYDDENRVIKVILPNGMNEYIYDANGLRTIKTDSAGTTVYIYDMNGNNIYEETI